MKNYLMFVVLGGFSLTGCYQKHLLMQAEVVSMTQPNAGEGKKLTVVGDVDEKWCTGDEPALPSEDQNYGLADQAIYKAQGNGKAADFIVDAKIYRDSRGCALITGKKAKI